MQMLKVKALVERWDCNKERKEEKEGQIWREKKTQEDVTYVGEGKIQTAMRKRECGEKRDQGKGRGKIKGRG